MNDTASAPEAAIPGALDAVAGAPSDDFHAKLSAHKEAVALVRQEAAVMIDSGDLRTGDQARRVHILAEAVEFVLNSAPPSDVNTPPETGFREDLKAADAKTK